MQTKRARSNRLGQISVADVRASVEVLVERGEFELAFRTLEHALKEAPSTAFQQDLLQVLFCVPQRARLKSALGALLTAQLLGNTRRAREVLAFVCKARKHLVGSALTPILAYEAWALAQTERYAAALKLTDELLSALSGLPLGLVWRARAQALAGLRQEGWREAFARARQHLDGRALGTCWLEEGTLLERMGDDAAARTAWREALPLLEQDALYAAWLRHALGLSCLRMALPEAEDHFLALQGLSKRAESAQFRARALCGSAAARRALGEWTRAESSYRKAIKLAREEDDLRQAWRGLGHTQRLAGKPELALEALTRAARCTESDRVTNQSWVFGDLAAAYLQLGHVDEARLALTRTGRLDGEDADRAAIVRAELARRAGDTALAVRELNSVRREALWAREEQACFPEVFALLAASGRPPLLARVPGTHVEVVALGLLSVRVNGRAVPLPATGRVAEVLLVLLESGGRATTDALLDRLYPALRADPGEQRAKKQLLWTFVQKLRDALGWNASIVATGSAYTLDPDVTWTYDVTGARRSGRPLGNFFEGNYSNWVQDVRQGV